MIGEFILFVLSVWFIVALFTGIVLTPFIMTVVLVKESNKESSKAGKYFYWFGAKSITMSMLDRAFSSLFGDVSVYIFEDTEGNYPGEGDVLCVNIQKPFFGDNTSFFLEMDEDTIVIPEMYEDTSLGKQLQFVVFRHGFTFRYEEVFNFQQATVSEH